MMDNLPSLVQGDWLQKAGPSYPTRQKHKGVQVAPLTLLFSRRPPRIGRKLLGSGWTIKGASPTRKSESQENVKHGRFY